MTIHAYHYYTRRTKILFIIRIHMLLNLSINIFYCFSQYHKYLCKIFSLWTYPHVSVENNLLHRVYYITLYENLKPILKVD